MIQTLLDRGEAFFKGVAFGCRACGQCVLRANAMTCPMRCPKGLRNGPCGGTLAGRCEVHPDRPCIHVRIATRRHAGRPEAAPIMPAIDHALCGHASLVNAARGLDRGCRDPLPALCSAPLLEGPARTASTLEQTLRSGRFAITTEVRAPRGADLTRVLREAGALLGHFDAVNATAYLSGNPSLPSSVVARELQGMGIEAIAQLTGRDCTRTTFAGGLFELAHAGVRNLLCLTGDWPAAHLRPDNQDRASVGGLLQLRGSAPGPMQDSPAAQPARRPMIKPVYDLDSSLMLYEARHLRDRARILHTGEEVAQAPRPFLGCAINPLSDPIDVPVRRMRQKADCGAEFAQTQVLTETARLARFMELAHAQGLPPRIAILAGIPVVTSLRALDHLQRIAGVQVDPGFVARLRAAKDLREAGVREAIALAESARAIPGIAGIHLILFGADHRSLVDVSTTIKTQETPCLSPA